MSLLDKDRQYVWHPFTQEQTFPAPIPIIKAEGVWLYDEEGRRYMDVNSSWWTILHGHCHPYMVKKLSEQIQHLDHVIFAGATHPKAIEAAERIIQILPGNFQKVFYSDNGSTAVEVALKMCYQFWYNKGEVKKKFLAIQGAYHGDTFGAMSVGERDYFNRPFEPMFFEVDYLPFPTQENWNEVESIAKQLMSSGEYAGFIFEPLVQGAAGMRIYKSEWLETLVQLAKNFDLITVADEVMTGFYRTGSLFAIERINAVVDIIALSKGLTGGVLPMGMTVTNQKMYDAFLDDDVARAFLHGHSYTGNPIAAAAICASLDLLLTEETAEKVQEIEQNHAVFCKKLEGHGSVKSTQYIGTILRVEVEAGQSSGYFSSMRERAYAYFIQNELLIRPLGNVIFVNPPYCITTEQLNYVYDSILDFLAEWRQTKNPSH